MLTLFLFIFVALVAWISGWIAAEAYVATVIGERDKLRNIMLSLSTGRMTTKEAVTEFYSAMGISGVEVDQLLADENKQEKVEK